MSADVSSVNGHTSSPTADEIAAAAGADDLFVLRRIGNRRFAHVGGVGRGAGWAGIIEVGVEDEPLLAQSLGERQTLRRADPEPWRVMGPYYARSVAIVQVTDDVVVVFGSAGRGIEDARVDDDELVALAAFAGEMLVEVAPAKRLADELEAANAVRDLLSAAAESFDEAMQSVVDHAAAALSCDLGILYIPEHGRVAVADGRAGAPIEPLELLEALDLIVERGHFPHCIQDAAENELPAPLSAADGMLAYYLLELEQPIPALLLLLHTEARPPRGFTLLCQSLGARLVDVAEPFLDSALSRDRLRAQLESSVLQARRDALTGLANRLAWDETVGQANACPDSPVSVIQLDCRGLKQINDTHGHHAGDELLRRVASALVSSARAHDLVARLGGDEFGVLLCGADETVRDAYTARVERALAAEQVAGLETIELAVGAATTRDGDVQAAQRSADARMLEAKRAALVADSPQRIAGAR